MFPFTTWLLPLDSSGNKTLCLTGLRLLLIYPLYSNNIIALQDEILKIQKSISTKWVAILDIRNYTIIPYLHITFR